MIRNAILFIMMTRLRIISDDIHDIANSMDRTDKALTVIASTRSDPVTIRFDGLPATADALEECAKCHKNGEEK